jgi:hypothetical protein
MLIEVLPVQLLRDAIPPYPGILAEPVVGPCQRGLINRMGQGVKSPFGIAFRSLCYLQKFR